MRVGVFGGSFDPIHHGHLIAAAYLGEALTLDEVLLVVARSQPLKGGGHGASAEHRARMVELAVQGDAKLRADRSELVREGPSYTADTLRELHTRMPGAELVLLLGADTALTIDRWRDPESIWALSRVETFAREGIGEAGLQVPRVDISSTAIRARVRGGRSVRYWLPDAVADYMAAHHLYQEP